ncbi:M42 family metallopeptidase [Desulfobacula toluolica]|uniref:Glutamyl aminopeptidase, M42 family n=1 Tax=Desulfobacula toluolica (strain DSM 7467 / Tol2) TaxID=651182 RepID=K0NK46_DESTT|nr:M42 family peptidase [Desulfobacula toluolica]CCK81901.1 glutamyl aminopeptidase, M42 family [Desulfobacula toluolica Tol2]
MNSVEIIEQLSNAPGVSGFEDEVIHAAGKYMGPAFSLEEDRIRNLFIHRTACECIASQKNLPKVMLDAHSDEVGFMIQSVNTSGTLKFLPLGGWNPQSISAHAVKIRNTKGKWIKGVVASKPTHFMTPDEIKKPVNIAGMVIDIGATSKKEVTEKFNIRIGAPVVPDVVFSYDSENDLIFGKAFDDRLGCAALLEIMKSHVQNDMAVDVVGVLSSQEELGLRGANISVKKTNPDVAIVLEGTPADDTFNTNDFIQAGLRKGPQIRHMDKSVLANPRFVKFAIDIAEKNKIPFQEAVRSSGGTNAGVINLHDRSVPTITLGIPVRYIHSHHGIATMTDFTNTVKWCKQILKNLNRDIIEGF